MTKVLHISTECYPAAKAGGMGDVVGALPKYLNDQNVHTSVIIPKYTTAWIESKKWQKIYDSTIEFGDLVVKFKIKKLKKSDLGFPLLSVDIPGYFDRSSIYLAPNGHGYEDEAERNILFQIAVLDWICGDKKSFDLLHCHDHMTGLIPFMIQHCPKYNSISTTPTFFTIHNGQYRGGLDWEYRHYLPKYNLEHEGLLDWDGLMHSLATAIKCAWQVNTVSPAYMQELKQEFGSLTSLINHETRKCTGILNGIDHEVWNPKTDQYLDIKLTDSINTFKQKNKSQLAGDHNLYKTKMLVSFIGRLAYEKGSDLISEALDIVMSKTKDISFILLGSGDATVADQLTLADQKYKKNVRSIITYDEALAHKIYAASDFLIMPSRFEPCGLNQMYAMRYGTIPVARYTGGLKDTVPDITVGGNGISFDHATAGELAHAILRAKVIFDKKKELYKLRYKICALNFSWDHAATNYAHQYNLLINN